MHTSISTDELVSYVQQQMRYLFPDSHELVKHEVRRGVSTALERLEICFGSIGKKYFQQDGSPTFNHLHSDQYAMFLYLFGNSVYRSNGDCPLAEKSFLLNKSLHALDIFYSVQLPEVFLFVHPVGSVIGNARYGNYFAIYQNCTVGSTGPEEYPSLGEGVVLYANSVVLGSCSVGDNVVFGANSFCLGVDIESSSTVLGQYPTLRVLPQKSNVKDTVFG